MKSPISIYLAVEDDLSEWVVRRVLLTRPGKYFVGPVFGKEGSGYLKRQTPAFNNAAKHCPFLLLTDFVITDWNIEKARGKCRSFERLFIAMDRLEKEWR